VDIEACETGFVTHERWFVYGPKVGRRRTHRHSARHQPLRPFHTVELNAVGWAALLGAAAPLAALLFFVLRRPLWLSISASAIAVIAVAITLDRRKEAASWVCRATDLTETQVQTVMAELVALGIETELSPPITYDDPENSEKTEMYLRHRHRDGRAVEQALARRRNR
jgi:hypothetical protein